MRDQGVIGIARSAWPYIAKLLTFSGLAALLFVRPHPPVRVLSGPAPPGEADVLEAYYREHRERYPSHPEFDLAAYDFPLYWFAIQREVDRLMQPTLASYDDALEDRQRIVRRLQFALPPVLVQEALNDLAGTGLARNRRFLEQIDAFHQTHIDFFEPLVVSKMQLRQADYAHMPRFTFREEPSTRLLTRVGASLVALVAISAALLGFACRPLRGQSVIGQSTGA